VLDRSGSMSERGKIEYLREAAKMAVRSLDHHDAVSVVEFDDRITLMWPASHAGDTQRLQSAIDELTPRGSTNLAGGLERGIEEARDAQTRLEMPDRSITRVILLSDGLANAGETDHAAIAQMAADAREHGVHVSSMGLGRDYDEDLMQAVAESGGGKYYYVESPVQLARIFEEELKTAFATSARNVRLAFHGSGAVKAVEIVGFGAGANDVTTDWPDFHSGEERTLLLRLEVDARETGPLDLGRFDVSWRDARSGASGEIHQPLKIVVTEDRAAAETALNKDVSVEAALSESERGLKANVKLFEDGKPEEARTRNAAIVADLKKQNATLADARLARKIEALDVEQNEMAVAAAAPPPMAAAYVKATKQRLYEAKSGNRKGYVLQPGDKGIEVENLQKALAKAGAYSGKVTGVYDGPTEAAVKAYQASNTIPPDGVAGAATQQKLGLF
jgi:Ca-activated chloride channel family protein